MKPDFALSLSFEGISLLTRLADGWHLLGEVTLDTEDLVGDLAKLRAKGEAVAKGPMTTTVVLPNDQIKYLTLDTGRARDAKRREAAIVALEESTPYRADQLSFDIHASGRATQVAAVARETLEEAEAFATEHAFNPVCFTAIPAEGAFDAAPDFGPTEAASSLLKGAAPTPDRDPIRIVSSGDLPAPDPEPLPTTEEAAPVAAKPAQVVEPSEDTEDTPAVATAPAPEPAPKVAEPEATEPPVAFASIRANRETPPPSAQKALGGARREDHGTNAPSIPGTASPTAERSLRFDPTKVVAGLKADATPVDMTEASEPTPLPEGDSGFVSRRTADKPKAKPAPKRHRRKKDDTKQADTEKQRLTVFGARAEQSVGGKPKYLGLIMTAVLLLFLAAVALWAALFLEDGVARLFGRDDTPQIVLLDPEAAVVADEDPAITNTLPRQSVPDTPSDATDIAPTSQTPAPLASEILPPTSTDTITDSAEIEAMEDRVHPTALSENEAEARYAVTGIWERAPEPPTTPSAGSTEDLYATSIDRVLIAQDAVALPDPKGFLLDTPLNAQLNPVAPGTRFELDDRGLVVASAQGTLNPEGVMVYLGRPAVLPPSLPNRAEAEGRALSREEEQRIASIRPRFRPDNLVESNERATLGGRSRAELGRIRPKPRPTTEKDEAETDNTPTRLAITTSPRPRQRPSNIAQLAQRSQTTEAIVATPAAATIKPKIPTTASVARQATIQNALNLNKINLIGVYGTSNNRRALVRLANGRYRKVQVGDRIDGGKVAAIGDQELRYVKSGRNIVLKMPKG